jgi:uncharacterized protein YxeA
MKKIIMKKIIVSVVILLSLINLSFTEGKNGNSADENWYLCSSCCKTKKATSAPWENECKSSSYGTHNYQFCGKAGNYNYTCRQCDAEVYLTSSTSPSASKCCDTGGTHNWYHK